MEFAMDTHAFLMDYRVALENKAKADVEVSFLEMKARLLESDNIRYAGTTNLVRTSRLDDFIEANQDKLEDSDIEFLQAGEQCTTAEVVAFTELTTNEVCKRLKRGIYRPGKSISPGRNWYDRLSIVEVSLRDGETDQK